ncbi:MAG: hypothetical protein KF681_17535 [Bdellovibrionaceae bacterium]|nr:hypothetical protein [Pseudobdellovibrionaceae bacterium]
MLPALSIILIVSICETGSAKRSSSGGNRWGIPNDGLWCKDAKPKGAEKRKSDSDEQPFASTIYNVPRQGVTPNFRAAVTLNGTGLIGPQGDMKVTYNNSRPQKNVDRNGEPCAGKVGAVAGSAGICLTPFFTVAADPRYYSIGDVICIPEIENGSKKLEVPLTRGEKKTHSGCFIVADKGSAIKGENRFDFFTGTAPEKGNPLTDFADKKSCNQKFQVYRAGSEEATKRMNAIDKLWDMEEGSLAKRYQNAGSSRRVARRR